MKLYEIANQLTDILLYAEENNISSSEFEEQIKLLEMAADEKIDNVASVIKNIRAESNAIKVEVSTLQERMKKKTQEADRLSDYLLTYMNQLGMKKFESSRNLIKIKKNPPSVKIDGNFLEWAKENGLEYVTTPEPVTVPNKAVIKDELKMGIVIPHTELVQAERLEIK